MTLFLAHASITSRMIEFCDRSGSSETIWRMTDIVTSVSIARTSFVPLSLIVFHQFLSLLGRDFSEANGCADNAINLPLSELIRPIADPCSTDSYSSP